MEAVKSQGSRYYRPELDVVRFLAFLLVFLLHILPGDDDPRIFRLIGDHAPVFYAMVESFRFGLSLFFTLSAFLIFELLLRERQNTGTLSVKQFYIRRTLRIWPLYFFAVALGTLVALLPGSQPGTFGKMGWFACFGAAWYMSLHTSIYSPVLPLWSISVEEQFYVFAPWVTKYLNRKILYGFCFALIVASNGWLYYITGVSTATHHTWFDTFVQFECFAAGILLALVLRGRLPKIPMGLRLLIFIGALTAWFLAVYPMHVRYDANAHPGPWPLIIGYALASIGSVMVLVAFLGIDPKFLPRWAIYLGRISFGLYVFHGFALYYSRELPIGTFLLNTVPSFHMRAVLNPILTLGLPLAVTFVMAMLSYRYLETPFLKMKKRHEIIVSEPVAEEQGEPVMAER